MKLVCVHDLSHVTWTVQLCQLTGRVAIVTCQGRGMSLRLYLDGITHVCKEQLTWGYPRSIVYISLYLRILSVTTIKPIYKQLNTV